MAARNALQIQNLNMETESSEEESAQIDAVNNGLDAALFLKNLILFFQKCFEVLVGGIIGYMYLYSGKYTQIFKSYEQEYLENHFDSVKKNIVVFLFLVLIVIVLAKVFYFISEKVTSQSKKNYTHILLYVISGCSFLIAIFWVKISHSYPYGDQLYIVNAASDFMKGNYSQLLPGGYIEMYPQQMGMTTILEILFRVFGDGKYYLFQYVNACFIPMILWSGYELVKELFDSEHICFYYLFLAIGCIQLLFYVPYIYGEIGSTCFSLLSSLCLIKYIKREQTSFLVGCIIFTACAVLMRKNALIFLIAELIVFLLNGVVKRRRKMIIALTILLGCVLLSSSSIQKLYEVRSNHKVGNGIPAVSFIAMGMQDTWPGPGWYNNYNKEVYQISKFDSELTSKIAKEELKTRLTGMWIWKAAGIEFVKQKLLTQWNEPTYGAFFLNNSFNPEPYEGSFVWDVFHGKKHDILLKTMNQYQFLIYGLFSISMLAFAVKRKRVEELVLPITIFGGFLFSIMWEAKSRYILPYFVFMIPYAAYGIFVISSFFGEIINRYFASRPEVARATRIEQDKTINDAKLGEFDDRRMDEKRKERKFVMFRGKE